MNGEVEIVINPDGTVELEVQGIKGTRCEDITDVLTRELGEVEDQHYTSEYYDQDLPDYVEEYN